MSKKLECEIVQDLLPMYVDQLTSDYTTQRVKEHLEECPPCHEIYDLMTDEEEEQIEHKKEAKKLKRYLKKIKLFHVIIGVIIAVGVFYGGVFLYLKLFIHVDNPVSTDMIEITELYELENGWIYLTLTSKETYPVSAYGVEWIDDALKLHYNIPFFVSKENKSQVIRTYIIDPETGRMTYYSDREKDSYYYRLAKEISIVQYAEYEFYHPSGNNNSINTIYYEGKNKEDRVLIWERGMELPLLDE